VLKGNVITWEETITEADKKRAMGILQKALRGSSSFADDEWCIYFGDQVQIGFLSTDKVNDVIFNIPFQTLVGVTVKHETPQEYRQRIETLYGK
jgi:hypothetical protein